MKNIDIYINKDNENSISRLKKFSIALLDYITLLLLSLMLFATFDSVYHITKAYKNNSNNITIYEKELVDIATSSKLTYIIENEDNTKSLRSIEAMATDYIKNQVYTVLLENDREIDSDFFKDSIIINKENDALFYYYSDFRVDNKENYINFDDSKTESSIKNKFLDLCKNDINNYFNNDAYPLLNVSIANEVYTHLKDNINEENSALNIITNSYQTLLEEAINEFMSSYSPYVEVQEKYSYEYDRLYRNEIYILLVVHLISIIIIYFVLPSIFKEGRTLFMKLFKIKCLRTDNNEITISNNLIRAIVLFITYLFTPIIVSLVLHNADIFISVLFTNFFEIFNLFAVGTLAILFTACGGIFTFYRKKRKQTIAEAIAMMVAYDDNRVQVLTIGDKKFELNL